MTDWHEDSAARSRRLRGEKTVEQRLADVEARLDALDDARRMMVENLVKWSPFPDPAKWDVRAHSDHDPLGR
jgi:hypothetical protein